MTEVALQFGDENNLVGILHRPDADLAALADLARRADRPAVLFLNAGVIHRIGPHRLHVKAARRLAARGIASLRLDLSGIGDSRSVPGELSFRESSVADARTAMATLERETGARSFAIFGLCSGADNALATAAVDERVRALVLIDPPAYATLRSRAREALRRARTFESPRALAEWGARLAVRTSLAQLRELRRRVRLRGSARAPDDAPGREPPPREAYRAELAALARRGVRVLCVYSGALAARYNDEQQLFEWFPELRGKIDCAYFPEATHTFTELETQEGLLARVTDWLDTPAR